MSDDEKTGNPPYGKFHQISGVLLELLAQIGYLGISHQFFSEAQVIFDAITAVRPKSKDAFLLRAVAKVFVGKLTEGTKDLVKLIELHPDYELAKSFLALAFKIGRADDYSLSLAKALEEACQDPSARALAKALVEFYDEKSKEVKPSLSDVVAEQVSR
jgi:hypothetical protein